jgi:hypothetical protein
MYLAVPAPSTDESAAGRRTFRPPSPDLRPAPRQERHGALRGPGGHPAFVAEGYFGGVGCTARLRTVLARPGENAYTHLSLLHVAGPLEALPQVSVQGAVELALRTQGQAAGRLVMRAQEASMKGPVSS